MLDVTADGAAVLDVHVQPGASQDEVVGRHGDALKVKVSAPPADGKANAAVRRLIAESFAVPLASVEVVGGAKHRRKRVRIDGIDGESAAARLEELLP